MRQVNDVEIWNYVGIYEAVIFLKFFFPPASAPPSDLHTLLDHTLGLLPALRDFGSEVGLNKESARAKTSKHLLSHMEQG